MFKQTDTKRVLFVHTLRRLLLGLFVFLSIASVFVGVFDKSTSVNAAANNTVNFQARLLGSAGNVAPDGNYNVEFKIYSALSSSGSSQGSCTGDAACLWSETRTGGNRVRVANGYMSIALGSVTAFPSTIDWSQEMWLTMNIGGSSVSASWDGEMNPRLRLTAVPYAMSAASAVRASTADILQNSGANASTLGWASQTAVNSILLPNTSGTVCLAGTEGCGFALNGGNTTGSAFTVGTNDNYGLNLEVNDTTVASFTNTGAATFKNASNSTAAFDIQNAGSSSLFKVDTTNSTISLGSGSNTDFVVNNSGANKAWSTESDTLPANRQNVSTTITNGYIYALGGNDGTNAQSTVYYAKVNADGSTGAWSTSGNALPAVRSHGSVVAANGYLYYLGGSSTTSPSNAQSTVYYAQLNSDGSVGTWNATTGLPGARMGGATTVVNGYVYYTGGSSTSSMQETVYYAKLNGNGAIGTWATSANSLGANTTGHTLATYGGYIYRMGGSDGFTNFYDSVSYAKLNSDGSTGVWSVMGTTLPGTSGYGAGFAIVADYMYVYGGYDGSLKSAVYYGKIAGDGTVTSWSTSSNSLPAARNNFGSGSSPLAHNGYLYVVGGYNGSGAANTIYYSALQRTAIGGSTQFTGSVSGVEAVNDNEFTTLGQVEKLMVGAVNTLSSSALINGGNSFGSALAIGTNDNYGMNFEVNGTTVASFTNTGAATFKNASNSTTAFNIQNAAGDSMLKVDTTNSSVVVGGTLQFTGDTTANRPVSPAEGTLYYDTDTKRLLIYANGKWQADKSTSTVMVAASDSTQSDKDAADFVATGTNDQDVVQDALDSVALVGGTVYLLPGAYSFTDSLSINYTNVTLTSNGTAIIVRAFDGTTLADGALIDIDSANGVKITNLFLAGQVGTYTSAYNNSIRVGSGTSDVTISSNGMGYDSGSGVYLQGSTNSVVEKNKIFSMTGDGITASSVAGLRLLNNAIETIGNHGISLSSVTNATVSGNTISGSSGSGISTYLGGGTTISNNVIGYSTVGFTGGSSGATLTGNVIQNNTVGVDISVGVTNMAISANMILANNYGVQFGLGVNRVSFTDNTVDGSTGVGVSISGANHQISGNTISNSGLEGLILLDTSDSSVSDNTLSYNASTSGYDSLVLDGLSTFANSITGNIIRSSGDGYAISLRNGNILGIYLSNNSFSTALGIENGANYTVFANQMQSAAGDFLIRPGSDSTTTFRVQNADGQDLLLVDTTNNKLTFGNGGTDVSIGNNGVNRAWNTASETLPANRQNAATVIANGNIYAIGGDNGTTAQSTVYYAKLNADGSTGVWQTNANALPAARSLGNAVVVGGYIYYIGGTATLPYDNDNASATTYKAKLNGDGSVGTWSTTTSLPVSKLSANIVTANGYIYVMGGVAPSDVHTSSTYYAKANTDGTIGAWSTGTNLTTARSGAAAVVQDGYIYLAGGYGASDTKDETEFAAINPDGSLGDWYGQNVMPGEVSSPVGAVAGGYMYVMGGWDGAGVSTTYYTKINDDGTLGVWESSPNAMQGARYYAGRGGNLAYNGYLYVVGGANASDAATNTVYYSALQRTTVGGSAVFGGSVSGADAVNSNDFVTLGQMQTMLGSVAGSNAILQGGNSFGSALTLGTNDNYGVNIKTNGNTTMSLSSTGATLLQNTTNSLSAFVVRNASGTTDVLIVDTATPGVTVNGSFTVNNLTGQSQTVRPGVDSLSDPQFKVQSSTGNNAFTVGTSSTLTQVGIGLGGTNVPTMAGNGLEVKGSIRISGTGADNVDTFTTPQGSSVTTRINVGLYDPGNFNQIVAMGLPSGASTSSRVLSIFDNRSGSNNQTPLAIFSPNESQVLGLGWDGQSTRGFLKTTSSELGFKIGSTSIGAFTSAGFDVAGGIAAATNSTTAFNVQNGSNQSLLLVDTTNSRITVGSGTATTLRIGDATNNTTFSSSTGNYELNGTARRTRTIMLQPEYTGAILDASSDATCSSANSGTLTSSVDLTNRKNYYNWMSTSGSAQCYNVIVQVPIPQDFSAWSSSTPLKVFARTSNTSNGTANIELRDSTGSVIYNYVSVTPGSTNTWSQTTVGTSISGTYTAGDFMTLRIRVSSNSSANIQLGVISMDYLSKW